MPFQMSCKRILIIDDNPGDVRLFQMMLRASGSTTCIVDTANRLSTGLDILRRDTFDVILLDLGLPDSQGVETVRLMRRHFPRIPVVVLTGREDDEIALESVREGAQDYLTKENLSSETLVRSLSHAVERNKIGEKLRESEELFKLITENAEDMISVMDFTGSRVYSSPSYEKVLGYSTQELKATPAFELVHSEDQGALVKALQAVRSGCTGTRIACRARHKDGSWRFLESTFSTIRQ